MIWWTQGVSEARPPACRAGALPLSYVSKVVMGGFDPPPRAFQAHALPTELHDQKGPAPGLEPGSTGLQSQRPSRWARPALLKFALTITPRRPDSVLRRRPRHVAAGRDYPAAAVPRSTPSTRRSLLRC